MLRRCVLWALLGIAFAPLFAPPRAAAQGRPIGLAERKGGREHAVELEFDFSSITFEPPVPTVQEITYTTLLPKVYGSFGLTDTLELEAQLTTIYADYSPEEGEGDSTFELANPYVALFYAKRTDRSVARIGGGVALPVLDVEDYLMAPFQGAATRGLMDMWIYTPEALSLVVPVQLQVRATMLVLGIDAALALMISTGGGGLEDDDDVEVPVQAGALVGAALGDVTLGLRLQVASILTTDGDNTQISTMPFIQADLDGGGFIHGGLLVNLDEPLGVLGDDNMFEVWALRAGGGARF
jgi:hypothetical protein